MKIISGSIDVTKIDKSRLYRGKKGLYLKISIILNDEKDSYDNDGFIKEEPTKEERERKERTTILGNVKVVYDTSPQEDNKLKQQEPKESFDDTSDIPF